MITSRPQKQSTLSDAFAAIAGAWPTSDVSEKEGAEMQRVIDSVGGLDLDTVPSAATPLSALAFAVVDRRGAVIAADAGFAPLLAGDARGSSLAALLRRIDTEGVAVGLAETVDGRVIALCAAAPEQALPWPLAAFLRGAAQAPGRRAVVMAFAPARASELALEAASTFGLSELEARVAVALLEAPTLEIAASRVGVGRETARDALAGAMRKMGVKRTPLLVRRLTDLICGSATAREDALADALDLTAGEARVARLAAEGDSTAMVAERLGVKPETVKSHLRSAFSKTGLTRAKDLGRFDVELHALQAFARAREVLPTPGDGGGRLRMIPRLDGRRVAFMDYGPANGRLVLVCHALASGRTLPPDLAEPLIGAGYRAIIPQRPGFGLSDPPSGDYLAAAVGDMAAIIDWLKRDTADIFARDIATAVVLAFAEAHPTRLGAVVLLNPEPFVRTRSAKQYAIPAAARLLQRHPESAEVFFEVLRRQTGTERLGALLRESFKAGAPSDAAGVRDPALLDWLVHDIQAMVARTVTGMVRERLIYASGWKPSAVTGGRWTVARCAELGAFTPEAWWQALPGARFESVPEGGLLLPMTHPRTVVRLLTERIEG